MKIPLPLIVLVGAFFGTNAYARCERVPLDPEVPAGLGGHYEIVGKDPLTGKSYIGSLVLDYGENSYSLIRSIGNTTTHGEAWFERCGADKILALFVRYQAKPVIEAVCFHRSDGDNYYQITCRSRQGQDQQRGLETWFQQS